MTREMYVSLDEKKVVAECAAQDVAVSCVERIPTGGVRLVCRSSHGAAVMKRKFKSHLITEVVTRERIRPRKPLW